MNIGQLFRTCFFRVHQAYQSAIVLRSSDHRRASLLLLETSPGIHACAKVNTSCLQHRKGRSDVHAIVQNVWGGILASKVEVEVWVRVRAPSDLGLVSWHFSAEVEHSIGIRLDAAAHMHCVRCLEGFDTTEEHQMCEANKSYMDSDALFTELKTKERARAQIAE
jgi:hypothetical protein